MTNDTRTPEEIEREIERERAGLTSTLSDLQDKFSVDGVVREFSNQFREHGGDIGRSVSEAVKRNPVALALTGVGLAWLMLGDKSDPRVRENRFSRDTGYGSDRYDADRYGANRTGSDSYTSDHNTTSDASRNVNGLSDRPSGYTPASRQVGSSNTYYSGNNSGQRNVPSWADSSNDHDDDTSSFGSSARNAASNAGSSISGAASSVADGARSAGSTVAGGARSAGASVADGARSAAGAVSGAGHSAADGARSLASSASDRAAALRQRLAEGTESLSEEARNRVIAARHRAVEARQATMTYARQGRDRAADIFEEQPLIAGALAVALGAALGAALPRSRIENEYMGEHSDHLMDEAERIFNQEKNKLTKVANAAVNEAKDIARETKDDANNAAPGNSVADAIVEKAKASGKRIADAADAEAKKQDVGSVKKS
ncbi:Protein of unknown function [Sulfitobacter brevis]|uniref:DUF3618 domain-containing protein n=2 Tax=Sulfitobacter brevis TaxID=74348 RepID=A0A1I2DW50_9RHOB|nr:Protein of unknown function [Sulfitobacter brevis]